MSKTSKILVSIGILFGGLFLSGLLIAITELKFFGIIAVIGIITGIRAVWSENDDKHKLNKNS